MVAEALKRSVIELRSCNLLKGFSVRDDSISIPILQNTDDTLLLLGNDLDMLRNVNAIFLLFEASSGLHVNNAKTKLFRLNEAFG